MSPARLSSPAWPRRVNGLTRWVILFCLGLAVDGKLHGMDASELIALLYFFADASNGLPYLMALNWGYGAGSPQSQSFEYGNTFLAVAGLLNLLVVLNAFDISVGRKK